MSHTALVWFRHDLRLADHPALHRAAEGADAVVPVFIWTPEEEGEGVPGGAGRWWLHASLDALDARLREKGSRLVLRTGPALEALRELVAETGAEAVYWNARYEPALRSRDETVREALEDEGIAVHTFVGRILHEPGAVRTGAGSPYQVFTPFWRKLGGIDLGVPEPLPEPRMGPRLAPANWPGGESLEALGLTPRARDGVDWAGGLRATWTPGEEGARARLAHFVEEILIDYAELRDRPDRDGTSRLSPHLHHGELSARQVWHAVRGWVRNGAMAKAAEAYLRQIAWREFAYHLLHHFPHTTTEPLKSQFAAFPWARDAEALEQWQRGRTGYPIVDAGMRQLWHTGWMHNRVRMVVASFLTKDLLIPWQQGAAWFRDTLVDADLANNTLGWQWAAGSGADAQPFFRIFNPMSQGERYDPTGVYVRRWVPELSRLPDACLHSPWTASHAVLREASVELGRDYPHPMVDHGEARERALAAYQRIR